MVIAGALLQGVERWVRPLDRLRRATYRWLVPWLGPWIRDRQVRIGLHGASIAVGSLVAAVLAPLWLLALSPLLLGVPHLVADVRYLVARPGLHRRRIAPLVGALFVLSAVLVDLRWGLAGAVVGTLAARASWGRRVGVVLPLVGVLAASLVASRTTSIVVAHVHNLVAVVLWLVLAVALHEGRPTRHPARWIPVGLFAAGGVAILTGALDPVWMAAPSAGPSLSEHLATLAPGLDPVWATRWVVAFAYAQAVHYGLWLRVMPEESRERPAPRSWHASLRALRADLGDGPLALAILLFGGIAVWGLVDLAEARAGYLRLALFHGPLELWVLGLVAAEGRGVLRP